ncbi:branched-chain amino acid ABC transporter permease [Microvirga puerhi]|uniref:Branched-chain amino acid ABC transporter permease n=1 Tax=Microvirga puerhi TaxID=2876078 RepID=A0ABS7VRQ1_9HYPH|nr:branched-chain amino acid ABC transporter permease [Microvirga puerhi]MBZ6077588.1 branched-chain amino acid ABC transporter permease [Microvirga puerhi]
MKSHTEDDVRRVLTRRGRWGFSEIAFWLVAVATLVFMPDRHLILNEIAIIALFALSLDLILGYAGIVSLGHAAFFGLGAYVAGILAQQGIGNPLIGLAAAALAAAILGLATSFLVLRGSDLTKLMVALGVALILGEVANRMAWLTGGADGLQGVNVSPLLGLFEFDMFGTTAYAYSLTVLFVLFVLARRVMASPYGLSLRSIRDNPLRARAIGIPVNRRLVVIYTLAAAYAGSAGALLAQTIQFVSLDVLAFHRSADVMLVLVIGGAGYLYGGIIGAVVFKILQDYLSDLTPQYWLFWIGLILVLLVLMDRERMVSKARTLWKRTANRLTHRAEPLATTRTAREI